LTHKHNHILHKHFQVTWAQGSKCVGFKQGVCKGSRRTWVEGVVDRLCPQVLKAVGKFNKGEEPLEINTGHPWASDSSRSCFLRFFSIKENLPQGSARDIGPAPTRIDAIVICIRDYLVITIQGTKHEFDIVSGKFTTTMMPCMHIDG
jgi:hypothetical protein